jgi:hypothetical protein
MLNFIEIRSVVLILFAKKKWLMEKKSRCTALFIVIGILSWRVSIGSVYIRYWGFCVYINNFTGRHLLGHTGAFSWKDFFKRRLLQMTRRSRGGIVRKSWSEVLTVERASTKNTYSPSHHSGILGGRGGGVKPVGVYRPISPPT